MRRRLVGFARLKQTGRRATEMDGPRSVPTIGEMASRGMRIVFIGTGEIGVPTLRALLDSEHEVVAVVTQPDKPAGREQRV